MVFIVVPGVGVVGIPSEDSGEYGSKFRSTHFSVGVEVCDIYSHDP